MLDEPTTGVDPVSRREFWKLLSEFLSQGITIVMSTPYLDEAERCSRVAFLHEGRLLASTRRRRCGLRCQAHCSKCCRRDHRRAVATLRSWPEVADVQMFGERAHVRLRNTPSDGATFLERHLRESGLDVTSVRQVPASLEDVFVTRLGETAS